MQVRSNSLLKNVDTWRPSSEGDLLERCAGAFEPRQPLARDDDDVVSVAWAAGVPAIKRVGHDSWGEASQIVALPAMRDQVCRGVLALEFDLTPEGQGAAEVWRPNERSELAVYDSWYANLERFGAITQHVKFPRRAGLPGKVWADRLPRVIGSLGSSPDFVRSAGAKAEGLTTALGVPFMKTALELNAVLVLLSAASTPLARAMEVWARDPRSQELKIVSADYGTYVDLAPVSRGRRLHLGEGIAGRVFRDHAPWMTHDLIGVEFPRGERFVEYGFDTGAGFPVFVGQQLVATVVFLN